MGNPKNAKVLTHEEIWDDSALVRSWDEAIEEYQLYHSIHAKGENVDDVLKEAEADGVAGGEVVGDETGEGFEEDVPMEAEAEDDVEQDGTATGSTRDTQHTAQQAQQPIAEPTSTAAPGPTFTQDAMPMPGAVLSNVQDEGLKRVMMAWYYAGYYSGLYEGQQQARQSKS